ncbi:MAG: 4a-hydroxytetrahydrobiopterin dehydratase [Candidatus Campbellbacteria bacterium]|nr:4a-hydroxytetrahydrobiopterin dehydratase [Candidatus Campbellbacteria bacterium]
MELSQQHCVPCEGGMPPMSEEGIAKNLLLVPTWSLKEGRLYKKFQFKTFPESVAFVNAIMPIAEKEGHHPDISIFYNVVELSLWTHAVDGLSVNDFILASKIDTLNSK